ncbi:MAG TPA: AmmeMemoRadiSam system protein A, partial [Oligoflexia bacterium]|nr:AmmeMemoRadiSam system protein A [Oligoflexia bacterium]
KALREAARVIAGYVDADTLIVVSSDLSHYHPYEEAVSLDRVCIKALEDLDMAAAARCEACGLDAAAILLSIARERGWKGKILDYRNSGDTAGSKAQVVGYSAIAYYTELGARRESPDEAVDGERGFSEMEKRALLRLSRETLHVAASGRKLPKIEAGSFPPNLHVPAACFVTLHKRGQLRGCIGHLVARMPLYECVVENTVHAALHDGRFDAVVPHELSQIEIEVSVLSPPLPVNEASRARLTDLLAQRHPGVIISRGPYQSTFLPQVWEQLPDTEHFLSNLCRKAGMESRCWQDSATQVSTYDVTAFNEHQPG